MADHIHYLIFDLDGTLIDSIGIWNRIDRELIENISGIRETEENIQKYRNAFLESHIDAENPYLLYCDALRRKYGYEGSAGELQEIRYEISRHYLQERVRFKPHVEDFLKTKHAEGCTLIIASGTGVNAMRIYREENRHLKETLSLFDRIYTKGDVQRMKPDPEIYERILADFHMDREDCLVFEDALTGVQAAKAAGLKTVAVYDRYSEKDMKEIQRAADLFIHDFSQYKRKH